MFTSQEDLQYMEDNLPGDPDEDFVTGYLAIKGPAARFMEPLDETVAKRLLATSILNSRFISNRERQIIQLRLGLTEDGQEMTLRAIAKKLGRCPERIRDILEKAYLKLQKRYGRLIDMGYQSYYTQPD